MVYLTKIAATTSQVFSVRTARPSLAFAVEYRYRITCVFGQGGKANQRPTCRQVPRRPRSAQCTHMARGHSSGHALLSCRCGAFAAYGTQNLQHLSCSNMSSHQSTPVHVSVSIYYGASNPTTGTNAKATVAADASRMYVLCDL